MAGLTRDDDSSVGVTGSAMGIGVIGAVGAVLLDVLHGGGGSVVISLIVASAVVIIAALCTFGLLTRRAQASAASRIPTDQLHGSPFFLGLPRNWDQHALRATMRNDSASGVCEVLAFRPMSSGGTEALLAKPGGPAWYNLDTLSSLIIEINSTDGRRKPRVRELSE